MSRQPMAYEDVGIQQQRTTRKYSLNEEGIRFAHQPILRADQNQRGKGGVPNSE
jgi:hypothetical protein